MKRIMYYYALSTIILCGINTVHSAEKAVPKKPDLSIAIPNSYQRGKYIFIQNFQSASSEPLINLVYAAPRMGAPLPNNPQVFDFEFNEPQRKTFRLRRFTDLDGATSPDILKKLRSRL